ncbi:nuclear transport factor 2 family protein [Ideonella sp. B508-1]|uniref:nuclear transport factor 2 family protein n=1 Tax=Ideonella sp. B508-1 TaxID=137716 RepID=UPI00034A87CD|nr:nuclear transport factor 2 family protein [Ideonella sp. B508-1]
MNDSFERRLARVEAQLEIQQLPARYALAVDSRDAAAMAALFAVDVDCGRWGRGREALQRFYESPRIMGGFYRSVHLICGQTVDFVDDGHATGTVYCRAGHEDKGHWVEMAICYFDRYVLSEGRWCFEHRDEKHWYSTDWQERPHGPNFQRWPGRYEGPRHAPQLPHAWPSWERFWTAAGDQARAQVTDAP